jgi:hypothetical protein
MAQKYLFSCMHWQKKSRKYVSCVSSADISLVDGSSLEEGFNFIKRSLMRSLLLEKVKKMRKLNTNNFLKKILWNKQ